jgi:ketosteroid isomerase-like protein
MLRNLLAGLVGVAVGVVATLGLRGGSRATNNAALSEADSATAYAGITALHRADSVATVEHDVKKLAALWDSAAIRIEPGGATVTKAAIIANDSQFFAGNPGVGVVQYASHIRGVSITGNSAIEWGSFDSQYVPKAGASPMSFRGNVIRGLRREANGEWKFTHVMWSPAQ